MTPFWTQQSSNGNTATPSIIIKQRMTANKEQNKVSNEQSIKMPLTVEEFRKANSMTVAFFQYTNFVKIVEQDYLIYRKVGWEQHNLLKTVLQLPGTAYASFNTVNADALYPGMLDRLSSDTQVIVALFPSAPQHKFPTPLLHLQRTIAHLLENSPQYRIDQSNIIFGGYSCGGTMTVQLAAYFANKSFSFKSILFLSPVFDYSGTLRDDKELSNKWEAFEKKDYKALNWDFIQFMNGIYSTSKADLTHPWYSPIFTPLEELKSLKNACFVYGEYDFMRRTIEAFKDRLALAKVDSQTILLEEEGHRCYVMIHLNTVVLQPALEQAIKAKKLSNLLRVTNYIKKILE